MREGAVRARLVINRARKRVRARRNRERTRRLEASPMRGRGGGGDRPRGQRRTDDPTRRRSRRTCGVASMPFVVKGVGDVQHRWGPGRGPGRGLEREPRLEPGRERRRGHRRGYRRRHRRGRHRPRRLERASGGGIRSHVVPKPPKFRRSKRRLHRRQVLAPKLRKVAEDPDEKVQPVKLLIGRTAKAAHYHYMVNQRSNRSW